MVLDLKHVHPNGTDYAPKKSQMFVRTEKRTVEATGYLGLFSLQEIPEGTVITIDGGLVFASPEDVPAELRKYSTVIGPDLYMSPNPEEQLNGAWLINHSCNSNVARIGTLILVAKKKIAIDEQLTLDYAPLISGLIGWRMDCQCGEPQCRKVIKEDDWKNATIAARLWPEWMPHIQRCILEEGIIRI